MDYDDNKMWIMAETFNKWLKKTWQCYEETKTKNCAIHQPMYTSHFYKDRQLLWKAKIKVFVNESVQNTIKVSIQKPKIVTFLKIYKHN